jgi:glutathione S-transferase
MATYRLYEFKPSPFCIKIRSILEYKGVEYESLDASRPAVMRELKRRGGIGKVPGLEIDGEVVCDSTDIAHALEARHPAPAILPSDSRERALSHALEDWADESLYWSAVYYRWKDEAGRATAGAIFGPGFVAGTVLPAIVHRVAMRQLHGQGIGRKSASHVARDLERHLQSLAALLEGRDFLVSPAPMLCDFAVNGQLVYLGRTPRGAEELPKHTPVVAFMERMKGLRAAS